MSSITFQLNGRWRAEANISPTTTLLDYLRDNIGLRGTKEGCAEGDCGACTVVVGLPDDGDGLKYKAVNSCLLLVPQLDGLPVVTIEGLAHSNGPLHPVQIALIEANATQCGFCTPGFAMSIFAFTHAGESNAYESIHNALAGNLCRCTGYRSIVDACSKLSAYPPGCGSADAARPASPEYSYGSQLYFAPRNLSELLDARSRYPDAVLWGGGTDLGLRISKEREAIPIVISTARVSELLTIKVESDALVLGGAVTYSRALPFLRQHFPAFADLVCRIGSRQIRNIGTFAANLANASPIGDTIPCLIALDAVVSLRSKDAVRTLKVDEFLIGYRRTAMAGDEVIESISIPFLEAGTAFYAYKVSKRFDQDISAVVAAFRLRLEGDRVAQLCAAYGGMSETTARARSLEAGLQGNVWSSEALREVQDLIDQDFRPLSDHRGSGTFRTLVAANLVRRLHAESVTRAVAQVWTL